jgi:hypothetical protein
MEEGEDAQLEALSPSWAQVTPRILAIKTLGGSEDRLFSLMAEPRAHRLRV